MRKEILGIMPLPYSVTYEGFATAMYTQFAPLNFNMAYARGAVGRIDLVESGTYQFAICSQYAAEQSIREGKQIEAAINFGPGSFLSRHVLLLGDSKYESIQDGMRVAYDSSSIDQSCITKNIIHGKKVTLVPIRTQQTVGALMDGIIDAGVWNYDDILEHKYKSLNVVFLDESDYNNLFSTAVMVIRKEDEYLKALLEKYVSVPKVVEIIREVREKKKRTIFLKVVFFKAKYKIMYIEIGRESNGFKRYVKPASGHSGGKSCDLQKGCGLFQKSSGTDPGRKT